MTIMLNYLRTCTNNFAPGLSLVFGHAGSGKTALVKAAMSAFVGKIGLNDRADVAVERTSLLFLDDFQDRGALVVGVDDVRRLREEAHLAGSHIVVMISERRRAMSDDVPLRLVDLRKLPDIDTQADHIFVLWKSGNYSKLSHLKGRDSAAGNDYVAEILSP